MGRAIYVGEGHDGQGQKTGDGRAQQTRTQEITTSNQSSISLHHMDRKMVMVRKRRRPSVIILVQRLQSSRRIGTRIGDVVEDPLSRRRNFYSCTTTCHLSMVALPFRISYFSRYHCAARRDHQIQSKCDTVCNTDSHLDLPPPNNPSYSVYRAWTS